MKLPDLHIRKLGQPDRLTENQTDRPTNTDRPGHREVSLQLSSKAFIQYIYGQYYVLFDHIAHWTMPEQKANHAHGVLKVSLGSLCFLFCTRRLCFNYDCVQLASRQGHEDLHMRGSPRQNQNKNNFPKSETNTEWAKSRCSFI